MAGAGLAVGLAYLTRPEGLFVAAPLGIAVLALGLRDARPEAEPGGPAGGRGSGAGPSRWPGRRAAVAFGVPLLLCVVPYAAFLHAHTGRGS